MSCGQRAPCRTPRHWRSAGHGSRRHTRMPCPRLLVIHVLLGDIDPPRHGIGLADAIGAAALRHRIAEARPRGGSTTRRISDRPGWRTCSRRRNWRPGGTPPLQRRPALLRMTESGRRCPIVPKYHCTGRLHIRVITRARAGPVHPCRRREDIATRTRRKWGGAVMVNYPFAGTQACSIAQGSQTCCAEASLGFDSVWRRGNAFDCARLHAFCARQGHKGQLP